MRFLAALERATTWQRDERCTGRSTGVSFREKLVNKQTNAVNCQSRLCLFCRLGAHWSNGTFSKSLWPEGYNFRAPDSPAAAVIARPCAAPRSPSFSLNSGVRRAPSNRNCDC